VALRDMPQVTEPLALRMEAIEKTYAGTHAVGGVDFAVRAGEIHALAGSNGAGKSTLMKIAQGVVRPDAGSVWIGGHRMEHSGSGEARRAGLAMVFQDFSLAPTLSVLDNIFLGAEPVRALTLVDRDQELREASELLDRLGVVVDLRAEVGRLGVGEQQMVEIAKALRLARTALLLDEPTAALSEREIDRLFGVLSEVRSLGIGIVFITHHLREIFRIADRVTVLRDGQVAMSQAIGETNLQTVIRATVGSDLPEEVNTVATSHEESDTSLLRVRSLSVGAKLRDLNFEVMPGEILGVAGLAGSGRTVLLKALFGAIRSQGTISLDGHQLTLRGPAEAIRAGIYLIPENRHAEGVILTHGVRENLVVSLLGELRSGPFYDAKSADSLARRIVRELSIRLQSLGQPVSSLSGGNQQKVVLGKALASNSKLLLLDEPTFGIDVRTAADLRARTRAFTDEGNAAMWVSSDLREVIEVADRILVLADGRAKQIVPNAPEKVTEEWLIHAIQRSRERSAA